MMKLLISFLNGIFVLFLTIFLGNCSTESNDADIVIYGGTSAGIAAAIQASRMDKSVILIEPSGRLGGLTTGGLGQTDIGNKQAIGGISREFYREIKAYYEEQNNWVWEEKSAYKSGGQSRMADGEDAMWTFEPSAALEVYNKMMKPEKIDVRFNQKLNRAEGVIKEGTDIVSIIMESGEIYKAKVFIDATYEGDLLATAGISYIVGREANEKYNETLNGVQPSDTSSTISGLPSRNGKNHNFVKDAVDPYIIQGDPSSGLLPGINPEKLAPEGSGDKKEQAYCFRMCLTDHPENRIPFEKPVDYDSLDYELLLRNFEAGSTMIPFTLSRMPNRKTDSNNKGGFSTDFIGQNYDYPEASYAEREKIIEAHRNYQKGLMWTLANHPRVPEDIRMEVARWGTSKDEFEREDGWQQQLYIREARRMIGSYVMTQMNCEGIDVVEDPVGLGAYGMDSHHVQRYVTESGFVRNEGNVEARVKSPYPISYRAIIPKSNECSNLLVPVCLSATHISFGSIRMEPVFMVLGQSAASAASIAIDSDATVQDIDYGKLKNQLLSDNQILK